jgi:hypothetical protein
MEREDTRKTKAAVRRWADLGESDRLVLDDELDRLRPATFRTILRTRINQEFSGEICFPISSSQWESLQSKIKLVRNLRDEVRRRRETGQCAPSVS